MIDEVMEQTRRAYPAWAFTAFHDGMMGRWEVCCSEADITYLWSEEALDDMRAFHGVEAGALVQTAVVHIGMELCRSLFPGRDEAQCLLWTRQMMRGEGQYCD